MRKSMGQSTDTWGHRPCVWEKELDVELLIFIQDYPWLLRT